MIRIKSLVYFNYFLRLFDQDTFAIYLMHNKSDHI
uniref:Uncharacterized protein n=1 Tax=Arundo donax TaxID=35708 RepID=A0A0A8ZXQ3_ARUDO